MARRKNAVEDAPPSARSGIAGFARFHNFDPKRVEYSSLANIPKTICVVGYCEWVTYRSDKWREGTHDYIHEITSYPKVVVGVVGSTDGQIRKVPKRIQNTRSVSLIGKCLGWGHMGIDGDGEGQEARPRGNYEWWWSSPGKALIVTHNRRKVVAIVWGGELNMEARGIVG